MKWTEYLARVGGIRNGNRIY